MTDRSGPERRRQAFSDARAFPPPVGAEGPAYLVDTHATNPQHAQR